jgi:predicted O-methyltransferase YrrM
MKIINKLKGQLLLQKEMFSLPAEKSLPPTGEKDKHLFDAITRKHEDYIKSVSSPGMAMSLELAHYLMAYCLFNKPAHLLDLGSGFSSFVFRLYQKNAGITVNVCSVDDNDAWLEKTKEYLVAQDLDTAGLMNLTMLSAQKDKQKFDLVLLDLNYIEVRKDYIIFASDLITNNGMVVIDDVHKVEFLREVKKIAAREKFKISSIREHTHDSFGRFAVTLRK